MSFAGILADIICETVGHHLPRGSGSGMLIQFREQVDYDKEEGYRYIDLLIYRPSALANNTKVLYRRRWTVIPVENLEYEDGDSYVKPGKSYIDGQDDGWTLLADHSSGWSLDGVLRFLVDNQKTISMMDSIKDNWFTIVSPETDAKFDVRNAKRKAA